MGFSSSKDASPPYSIMNLTPMAGGGVVGNTSLAAGATRTEFTVTGKGIIQQLDLMTTTNTPYAGYILVIDGVDYPLYSLLTGTTVIRAFEVSGLAFGSNTANNYYLTRVNCELPFLASFAVKVKNTNTVASTIGTAYNYRWGAV